MTGSLAWVLALSGAASGLNPDVAQWVRARAQAYEAHLKAIHVVTPRQLWHERPPNESAAPNFVGPTSLAPLIRAVSPCVVNIKAGEAPAEVAPASGGDAPQPQQVGSGFLINADGIVITNNHVVEAADVIRVRLADGRDFAAAVIGRDASTDIALLKLDTDQRDLPIAYLGDSDRLQVGDWVLAIGNPFELDHTASHGIISAKERQLGIGMFDDFIQTDALINPGNSGGPLFNMRGEVVGVNTARQGQGIGFAIPINMVKDLIPNLSVNGRLARGWLGVKLQEVTADAEHRGAVVYQVFDGSPAAAAGIEVGDRVVAVNGHAFESYLELQRRVAFLPPGTDARLTLTRGGATREVTVTLAERQADDPGAPMAEGQLGPIGLVVLPANGGVLVASVSAGSAADRFGIKAGDVILEVNRIKVQDVRSYRDALDRALPDRKVLIFFQRGDSRRYVTITLD